MGGTSDKTKKIECLVDDSKHQSKENVDNFGNVDNRDFYYWVGMKELLETLIYSYKQAPKMSKEEFDKLYVGENLVVNCRTEELANEFLALANSFGYKWFSGKSYVEFKNYWVVSEENTCYNISKGTYGTTSYWLEKDYEITIRIYKQRARV